MNKELKKILSDYKKICFRKIKVKLDVKLSLSWVSDESYDVSDTDILGYDNQIKKYNKELKRFCIRVDKYGKKNFNDKWYVWKNYLWKK